MTNSIKYDKILLGRTDGAEIPHKSAFGSIIYLKGFDMIMEEKKSLKGFLCSQTGGVVLTVAVYAVTLLIMAIIGGTGISQSDNTVTSIISIILFGVWAVLGWKGLSKIQPNIFLIMPVAGWVVYFIVKGVLSIILGIFIAPYQIAKIIRTKLQETL